MSFIQQNIITRIPLPKISRVTIDDPFLNLKQILINCNNKLYINILIQFTFGSDGELELWSLWDLVGRQPWLIAKQHLLLVVIAIILHPEVYFKFHRINILISSDLNPLHFDADPGPGIMDPDPTKYRINSIFFLIFFCKRYNTHKDVFFLVIYELNIHAY